MVAIVHPVPSPSRPAPWSRVRVGSRDILRSAQRVAAMASSIHEAREASAALEGLPHAQRAAVGASVLRRLSKELLAAHQIQVDVRGRVPTGPVVLVANHLGYFDPLVVAAQLPCVPLAQQEAASWPLLGEAMRALGVVFVARGEPASGAAAIRTAMRVLEGGTSVLGFPEGTTTRGDRLLPLKHGLFVAARRVGVAVVPVEIRYARPELCWVGDDAFLPHYLRATRERRIDVRVTFGPSLDARVFPDAATLSRATRAIIGALQLDVATRRGAAAAARA